MPFGHGSLVINLGEDEQSSPFCVKMHNIDTIKQHITIDMPVRRAILLIVDNTEKGY
jgi:hypothetical protein